MEEPTIEYTPRLFPRLQAVAEGVGKLLRLGAVTEPALAHREPRNDIRAEASDY